jgi:glycosyltransferase involved in cell wall biosynthesis
MKVTIITVCFNSVTHIRDCIDSVSKHSYVDIEHLFIDGKSSDGTLQIIRSNARDGHVLLSENDEGIYDAMNKGLKMASGDIIGFLNSDDVFDNQFVVETIVNSFVSSDHDVLWGDLHYVKSYDIGKIVRVWNSRHFSVADVKKGFIPAHPTFYISRRALEILMSFDLQYTIASDFDFMKRAIMHPKLRTGYLNYLFVRMRTGGASSSSISVVIKQNCEIIRSLRGSSEKFSYVEFFYYKVTSKLYSIFRGIFMEFKKL